MPARRNLSREHTAITPNAPTRRRHRSIFSSKDEPEDGGWGFLRSWGSFLVFWF